MITKTLFDCAIIVTILFSLCNNNKFAEGVLKESQGRFDRNKKFIYELSFKGKIFEKKICRECEINKYSLKIGLIELSEKPIISNVQFNPYYFFENDNQLNISVSEKLYNQVKINDEIIKEVESFNLKNETREFIYLNKEKYKWLP